MLPALSGTLPDNFTARFARGFRQHARAPQAQFHLIFFRERPGLDAAFAQIARKLGGETMEGEHAPGPHKIDIAKQVVVISVVRKRKSGINLIAINRVGISRPATDHRNAFVRNFFQHARSICAGWTDEDFSRDIIHVVAHVFTERLAELFVDAGHLIDGAVQHGR